MVVITTFI